MYRSNKFCLATAATLTIIGCMLFVCMMSILNWDFTKLSTVKYETNVHTISEEFNNISVVTHTADFDIVPSDDGKITVTCHEEEKVKHSVSVTDGILKIEVNDTRKWYEHIGISFDSTKITVKIPAGKYTSLTVDGSTGNYTVSEDFGFESVNLSGSTSDVTCLANVSESVKIKTSTGKIQLENADAVTVDLSVSTGKVTVNNVSCKGKFTLSVSTGDASLSGVLCGSFNSNGNTGKLTLKNVIVADKLTAERTTGDVKFDSCDAREIFIETSTGDVIGSLLSDKVFISQSSSGSIDIPKTLIGGKCEIITSTGNIKVTVK